MALDTGSGELGVSGAALRAGSGVPGRGDFDEVLAEPLAGFLQLLHGLGRSGIGERAVHAALCCPAAPAHGGVGVGLDDVQVGFPGRVVDLLLPVLVPGLGLAPGVQPEHRLGFPVAAAAAFAPGYLALHTSRLAPLPGLEPHQVPRAAREGSSPARVPAQRCASTNDGAGVLTPSRTSYRVGHRPRQPRCRRTSRTEPSTTASAGTVRCSRTRSARSPCTRSTASTGLFHSTRASLTITESSCQPGRYSARRAGRTGGRKLPAHHRTDRQQPRDSTRSPDRRSPASSAPSNRSAPNSTTMGPRSLQPSSQSRTAKTTQRPKAMQLQTLRTAIEKPICSNPEQPESRGKIERRRPDRTRSQNSRLERERVGRWLRGVGIERLSADIGSLFLSWVQKVRWCRLEPGGKRRRRDREPLPNFVLVVRIEPRIVIQQRWQRRCLESLRVDDGSGNPCRFILGISLNRFDRHIAMPSNPGRVERRFGIVVFIRGSAPAADPPEPGTDPPPPNGSSASSSTWVSGVEDAGGSASTANASPSPPPTPGSPTSRSSFTVSGGRSSAVSGTP